MTSCIRSLMCVFAVLVAFASCSRRPSQQTAENEALLWVDKWVRLYEVLNPGIAITNLEQVYRGLNRSYPHTAHNEFKAYGKHAGFRTSFFEKYVFFLPGNTSHWAEGEIVFMNAQPFPFESEKGMGRRVVIRNSDDRYRTLNEKQIQKILIEEGIKPLPIGYISPPRIPANESKPPLHLRIQSQFARACDKIGLGIEATANLWRIAVWSPLLITLLVASLWFFRRSRQGGQ